MQQNKYNMRKINPQINPATTTTVFDDKQFINALALSLNELYEQQDKLKGGQEELFKIILAEKNLTHQLMSKLNNQWESRMMDMENNMREGIADTFYQLNVELMQERDELVGKLRSENKDKFLDALSQQHKLLNQKYDQMKQNLSAKLAKFEESSRSKYQQHDTSQAFKKQLLSTQTLFRQEIQEQCNRLSKIIQRNSQNLLKAQESIYQQLIHEAKQRDSSINKITKELIQFKLKVNGVNDELLEKINQVHDQLKEKNHEHRRDFDKIGKIQQEIKNNEDRWTKLATNINGHKQDLKQQWQIKLESGINKLKNQWNEQVAEMKYQAKQKFQQLTNSLQELNDSFQFWTVGGFEGKTQLSLVKKNISKIPRQVYFLKNLKQLKLSQNNISELSQCLGNLTNLEILILDSNKIQNLPSSIGNLHQLRLLKVSKNLLASLPKNMNQLVLLKQLDVSSNKIKQLRQDFFLPSLQKFEIDINKIKQIPECLGKFIQLKSFSIFGNQLQHLPVCIFDLPLTSLWVSNNKIQEIPPQIANLTELTSLNISRNKIKKFPQQFFNLKKLSRFYLSNIVDLRDSNLVEMLQHLGNLDNLAYLCIQENGLETLPQSITNLKNLQALKMHQNNLAKLPQNFSNLKLLQDLELTISQESEITLQNLHVEQFIELKKLTIYYHKERVSEEIQKFTKLCQSRDIELSWM